MSPHTPPFFLARVRACPESYCFHEESLMSHGDDTVALMTTPCHLPSPCLPAQHSLQSQVCPRQGKVSVTARDSLVLPQGGKVDRRKLFLTGPFHQEN